MSDKKWYLSFSSGTGWSDNYDRIILPKLQRGCETRLYQSLTFDFNPYITLDEAIFDEIHHDAAFIETANRAFLPIRNSLHAEVIRFIKLHAIQYRKDRDARDNVMRMRDVGQNNPLAVFIARPKSNENIFHKRQKLLSEDLLLMIYAKEDELEMEARNQIANWKKIPLEIKKNDTKRLRTRILIGVKITAATVGVGLATTGAVFSGGLAIMGAIGAWYGLARTVIGSAQELHLLRASTKRLLSEIQNDLQTLKEVINPKARALGAGAVTGFTGAKGVTTTSTVSPKVAHLKTKLPKLKMLESRLGKDLNAYMVSSENLKADLSKLKIWVTEVHRQDLLSDEKLASVNKFIEDKNAIDNDILKQKVGTAFDREQTSFDLEQILRNIEQGLMEIQRVQGVWPARLETALSTLISIGLSSGIAGGAASGGIDVSKVGGVMDTIGLPIGGISDLYSVVEAFEENQSPQE